MCNGEHIVKKTAEHTFWLYRVQRDGEGPQPMDLDIQPNREIPSGSTSDLLTWRARALCPFLSNLELGLAP